MPSQPSAQFSPEEVALQPKLQDVYGILQEGFPNLLDYPIWLTDVSHRCRHGMSHVLTYRNSSTLTLVFDWKDQVLVGQVATRAAQRGSGYARDFLRWTAQWLAHEGYDERFGARPLRRTLQHSLEDTAADMLLDGRIARGDRVTAVAADGGIILVRDGGS